MADWPGPLAHPATAGLDPAALSRLGAWQHELVAEKQVPFAITLLARQGKVAFVEAAGELRPGVPIELDAICRMHSMSKPVTSVALMMLHDSGAFELSDPVHKYLGAAWKKENMAVYASGTPDDYSTVPCETDITMHQMLTHTAGLTYGLNPEDGRLQAPYGDQIASNPVDGVPQPMAVLPAIAGGNA